MINKIKSYIKTKADQYEIYYSVSTKQEYNLNNNKIDSIIQGKLDGLGIRILIDKKVGFSSTLIPKKYKECIDRAIKIAKQNNPDKNFISFAKPNKIPNLKSYSEKGINWDTIQEYLKEVVKKCQAHEIHVSSGSLTKNIIDRTIINSEGINITDRFNINEFEYGLIKNNIDHYGLYQSKEEFNIKDTDHDIERLKSQFNRSTMPTTELPLLLHPDALTQLFKQALLFNIDALNVLHKKSSFKINQQIFPKNITIIDDPTKPSLLNTKKCDAEGLGSQKTRLIEKGKIRSFLHNSYSAYQQNLESTGNAVRVYSSQPSISSTNIIMQQGKCKEIFNQTKKYIYIKGLQGVHTMDSSTGNFSLGVVEGHLMENDKIKFALKDTMVAGNLFDLMQNILAIENKTLHGHDGFYLPHILFEKVKIIGH